MIRSDAEITKSAKNHGGLFTGKNLSEAFIARRTFVFDCFRRFQRSSSLVSWWAVLFSIGLVLSSCTAATTGTRISLDRSNLTQIKSLGVIVRNEEGFSVRFFREGGLAASSAFAANIGSAAQAVSNAAEIAQAANLGSTAQAIGRTARAAQAAKEARSLVIRPPTGYRALEGAAAGIGAAAILIEADMQSSKDAELEEQFKPIMGGYDPRKFIDERLRHHLQAAKAFTVSSAYVEDHKLLKAKKIDAVLELTLKQWGLHPCMGHPAPGEKVQVRVNVYGEMVLLKDNSTVWEHNELYSHGECHSLEDFRSHEGMLKTIIEETIDNLAGKIVNEILYP